MERFEVGFGNYGLDSTISNHGVVAGHDLFFSKEAFRTASAFAENKTCEVILQVALQEMGGAAFVQAFLDIKDLRSAYRAFEACLALTEEESARLFSQIADMVVENKDYRLAWNYWDQADAAQRDRFLELLLETESFWDPTIGFDTYRWDRLLSPELRPEQHSAIIKRAVDAIVTAENRHDSSKEAVGLIRRVAVPKEERERLLNFLMSEGRLRHLEYLLRNSVVHSLSLKRDGYELNAAERHKVVTALKARHRGLQRVWFATFGKGLGLQERFYLLKA